ncbi:MAG TPA: hypothetical protein VGS28_03395 [Candidatus Saccharimonadales bacterium]|nr:hypothetical protein [Candidatus Saccharimonadales bacterium]
MFEVIGIASGVLSCVGYIPYIRDILRSKARPERATWLIWSVLSLIAFFAQLNKGATQSLWFTGFNFLTTGLIFSLSIKRGIGGLARRDIIGLLTAAIGLALWYLTGNALYALIVTIAVDTVGSILTILKTYDHPWTETYTVWVLDGLASILAVISVGRLDYTLMLYPFVLFVSNFIIVGTIYTGRHLKKPTSNKS